MMNGTHTISEMLEDLATSPQKCDNFNANPAVYMTAFGLSNQDRQTVLEYIAQNTWKPGPFIDEYAPDERDSLEVMIIC